VKTLRAKILRNQIAPLGQGGSTVLLEDVLTVLEVNVVQGV
jgi:hypothetical protein